MKALSVKQPWATLIANGKKTIETRKWKTNYRGKILICSSKAKDRWYYGGDYPLGVAMCVAELVDVRPFTKKDVENAHCEFYEDAWAWELDNVVRVEPIPVKGQLGIFNVDLGRLCLTEKSG